MANIAPAAPAPGNVAVGPRYWIEFGVYDGEYYARVLEKNLGNLGIEAIITRARGKGGRSYIRVRSGAEFDRTTAMAESHRADTALHISPLLHRAAERPTPAEALGKTTLPGQHWVQFGAFRPRHDAEAVATILIKNGMNAIVLTSKSFGGRPLYRVRVESLASRAAAERIAHRGELALHSKDVLVGRATRPNPTGPPA